MRKNTAAQSDKTWSLIDRLRVSQKLLGLSLVFIIPTLVAIGFLVWFMEQQISFADKEHQGVVVMAPLGDFALAVQSHSGASATELNGGKPASDVIADSKRRAEADITAVDNWIASSGSSWGLADRWTKIKTDWIKLQQRPANDDSAHNAEDHSKLAGEITSMIGEISDISNVTLDPEMAAYTLGDTIVNQLPSVAADVSGVQTIALGGLASADFSTEKRAQLQSNEVLASDALERVRGDIEKGGATESGMAAAMSDPLKTVKDAYATFAQRADQVLGSGLGSSAESRQAHGADLNASVGGLFAELTMLNQVSTKELDRQLSLRLSRLSTQRLIVVGSCLVVLLIALGFATLVTRNLTRNVGQVTGTVERVAQGDYEARVKLRSQDEIGSLARAFDSLLDERVAGLQRSAQEKEIVNNSVVRLLQAVAQLSKRDLTVKVPVSEDVTGPVADALNQLTKETAKVLAEVTSISADVGAASLKVKQQSDTVVKVAEDGRQQVDKTAEDLASAARAMNDIAALAQTCNIAADKAIKTAQSALQTVNDTVGGINNTRDTIRETEKRIKRLGERSQEINSAVNLINTIAERTHILALNASMHAASAGEAGRGFAVVAEEVQRLAENARQATAQIATLVNNIQVETADTVNTMNSAITQVVEGSKLAERAGEEMRRTQETTAELVGSVQKIAASSMTQAEVSNQLLQRAGEIKRATQHTSEQLHAQSEQTTNLVEYSKSLLSAVRVFKLIA